MGVFEGISKLVPFGVALIVALMGRRFGDWRKKSMKGIITACKTLIDG
jgi:hypothetical protein